MTDTSVPDDFPHRFGGGVVSGAHPRVCCVRVDRTYVSGETSSERGERWALCDDLAQQLVSVARSDAADHPGKTTEEVLARVGVAVERKNWVSAQELAWLIRRLQTLLGW